MPMVNDNASQSRRRLGSTPVGETVRVVDVEEPGPLGERLLEMGLTRGTEVRVVRRGLFGDPMQLSLRGTMLSIRRAQAMRICVEPLPAPPVR